MPITTLSRSARYTSGQQARALVLDLLAQQERAGRLAIEHDAFDIDAAEFGRAWTSLRDDGLAYGVEGEPLRLTDAGREAHAAAERAITDIEAALPLPPQLPSLKVAFGRRAALFGVHA